MRERGRSGDPIPYMCIIEFNAAIFALFVCSSDRLPTLWWLSTRREVGGCYLMLLG